MLSLLCLIVNIFFAYRAYLDKSWFWFWLTFALGVLSACDVLRVLGVW